MSMINLYSGFSRQAFDHVLSSGSGAPTAELNMRPGVWLANAFVRLRVWNATASQSSLLSSDRSSVATGFYISIKPRVMSNKHVKTALMMPSMARIGIAPRSSWLQRSSASVRAIHGQFDPKGTTEDPLGWSGYFRDELVAVVHVSVGDDSGGVGLVDQVIQ